MDCQIQRIDAKIDAGEKRIAWMGEKLNQKQAEIRLAICRYTV